MKSFYIYRCLILLFYFTLFVSNSSVEKKTTALPVEQNESGLFTSDEVLPLTLKGNLKDLFNDRSDEPSNFACVLSYNETNIPVQVKTRGHFRRLSGNCSYPPLLIQFDKEGPQLTTIFKEQKKLKLVMPCRGDEYAIREWLVYKIYNLITPYSFRARLVKLKLEEDGNKKSATPFYGILLEEESQMAERNQMVSLENKLQPQQTQTEPFLTMAVFEYLIANTDWSTQYLQNIKLLAKDSMAVPIAVPYDFDHAGIVNAPYALPTEELQLRSLRERRYRGYCMKDIKQFEHVIAKFNQLKTEIYSLYTGCTLLDAKYIKNTTQFLDEFYTVINNPKLWQKEFAYPCDKNGTGNVIIKGLKTE